MASDVSILSDVNQWIELLATNDASLTFPSVPSTTTEPTGAGVVVIEKTSGQVSNNVMFVFFGAGSDNQTFDARIYGWQQVAGLWVPVLLAQISCTLCGAVGVAGKAVLDTERFVDTYSLLAGFNANVSVELVTPANDQVGYALVDVRGFSKFQVVFDMTGATSANALYKSL